MKFLALLFLISAATAQLNPAHFTAQIVRQTTQDGVTQITTIAHGVIVNPQYVVTVASPLVVPSTVPRGELRVFLQTTTFQNSTDRRTVEEDAHIHPDFNRETLVHNIAILKYALPHADTNVENIRPRRLGELTNVQCRTFMFPGGQSAMVTQQVTVRNTSCPTNRPFCATTLLPEGTASCTNENVIGAATICANDDYVAGIATSINCALNEFRMNTNMTFISIQPYYRWISDISGAEINAKISLVLVLLGVVGSKLLM